MAANPFDQFDNAANPFDQFDAPEVQGNSGGAVPAPAAIPENTLGQEAKRQGGLFLRQALSAAGSVGAVPADAIGKAVNYVAGREVVPNQQQAFQNTLTRMGLPEPERAIEKFGQGFAESAPAVALPASIIPQVLGNAAMGAAQAPAGSEGSGAAWGAGGGALGQAVGRVAGGIVKPTPEAQVLLDRGVALTPGQAAGKGSLLSNLEQKATSIPVAGHLIEAARNRGLNEANVAAAQSVANIVDKNIKLGQPPREAIEQTRDAISKHYDAALANLSAPLMTVGNSLESAVPDIIKNNPMMTGAAAKQLERYVQGRFQQLVANGVEDFNGPQLKQLDSEIGGQIRNLQSSTNASDKVAAPAWRELQVRLRKVMADHAAGNDNQMLNQANAAYQQLLLLEKAMLPGADTFTPRQLRRALEGRKAADLGNTELSQVANAMDATLPNTVPDSGTTSRMLANALPLLTGGIGYGALGMPVAGMLLGTRTGAKAMTGSLPQQQALAQALRRFTPAALRGGKKDD